MPQTLADFIRGAGARVLLETGDPDNGAGIVLATSLDTTAVVLVLEDPDSGAAFVHLGAAAARQLRDALAGWLDGAE